MTKIFERYCLCAIILVTLVLIIYYNWLGRSRVNRNGYSDEFVAVAYLNDYDVTENDDHSSIDSNRLLNLTHFQYLLEPNFCDKKQNQDNILGKHFFLSFIFDLEKF